MNSFFDYIYYRVCKVFFKWDGIDGHRALWAVTMIQTVLIADFVLAFFAFTWGRASLFPYSKILGYSVVGILIILAIVNSRKYDGRYNEFDAQWKDEFKNRKLLKGILVIISMSIPWIGLFLISRL